MKDSGEGTTGKDCVADSLRDGHRGMLAAPMPQSRSKIWLMLGVDVPVVIALSIAVANGLIPAYPIAPIIIALLFAFNFLLIWRSRKAT
jgi:hypothetical protein